MAARCQRRLEISAIVMSGEGSIPSSPADGTDPVG